MNQLVLEHEYIFCNKNHELITMDELTNKIQPETSKIFKTNLKRIFLLIAYSVNQRLLMITVTKCDDFYCIKQSCERTQFSRSLIMNI